MADKTLRIKIESVFSGEDGLRLLNEQLVGSEVKVKKLISSATQFKAASGTVFTGFTHNVELTSKSYSKLTEAIDTARNSLAALNATKDAKIVQSTSNKPAEQAHALYSKDIANEAYKEYDKRAKETLAIENKKNKDIATAKAAHIKYMLDIEREGYREASRLAKEAAKEATLLDNKRKSSSSTTLGEAQAKANYNTALILAREEGNKILAIQLELAEKKRQLATKSARDLADIETRFRTGAISFINSSSERNRILEVEQTAILSATRIANARIAAERLVRASVASSRTNDVALFRSGNVPTATNRDLQLQAAGLRGGSAARSAQDEIRSTHIIEDIRTRHAATLLRIEQQLDARIISLTEARRRRAVAIASLARDQSAEQIRIAGVRHINDQIAAEERLAASHRSLARQVFDVVGLYKIYNNAIGAITTTIRGIPQAGIELETTKAVLTATTGSAAGTVATLEFLNREAARTGIAIGTVRESFRNFYASTSLAGESLQTTSNIFRDMNSVISGLHYSAAKADGIFNALSQIFNKTKVQSEELVKQLGNLLPGAFPAFAAATGRSRLQLVKDMKDGLVTAHGDVEKFAAFMAERFQAATALATTGLNYNIGNLQTAFTRLQEQLYSLSSGAIISTTQGLTTLLDTIRKDSEGANYLGTAIKDLAIVFGVILGKGLLDIVAKFFLVRNAFTGLTGAMVLFKKALPILAISGIVELLDRWYEKHNKVKNIIEETNKVHEELLRLKERGEAKTPNDINIAVDKDPDIVSGTNRVKDLDKLIKSKEEILANTISQEKTSFGRYADILKKDRVRIEGELKELKQSFEFATKDLEAARQGVQFQIEADIKSKQAVPIDFTEASNNLSDFAGTAASFKKTFNANILDAKRVVDDFNTATKQVKIPNTLPVKTDNVLQAEQFIKDSEARLAEILRDKKIEFNNKIVEEDIKNKERAKQLELDNIAVVGSRKLEESKKALENFEFGVKANEIKGTPIDKTQVVDTRFILKQAIKDVEIGLLKAKEGISNSFMASITSETKKIGLTFESVWAAITEVESRGAKDAVSVTGALGRRQVQPNTAKAYTDIPDYILDLEKRAKAHFKASPKSALPIEIKAPLAKYAVENQAELEEAAKKYFKHLVDITKGDLIKAAAGYNTGEGNLAIADRKAAKGGGTYREYLHKGKADGHGVYDNPYKYTYDVEKLANKNTVTPIAGQSINRDLKLQEELHTAILDKQNIEKERSLELLQLEKDKSILLGERKAQLDDINLSITKQLGSEKDAELAQIEADYLSKKKELEDKGNFTAILRLDILKKEQLYGAEINNAKRQYQVEEERYNTRTEDIARKVQIGQVSQVEATRNLIDEQTKHLDIQDKITKEWEKQVGLSASTADNVDFLTEKQNRRKELDQQAAGLFVKDTGEFGAPKVAADAANSAIDLQVSAKKETTLQDFNNGLITYQAYKDQEVAIDEAASEKKNSIRNAYYSAEASLVSDNLRNIGEGFQVMFGKQSSAARAAFAISKAAAIASATINTYEAATKAYAQGGILGGISAGIVVVSGLANIAKIQAQQFPAAHGGLDYVPAEQTYLLNKGERVLSPKQNKDITGYVQEAKKTQQVQQVGEKPKVTVHNHWGDDVFDSYTSSDKFENAVYNVIQRNR